MTSAIRTDLSRWPIVVVTFPEVRPTDDDVREFVVDQRAMVNRREPHVIVVDARKAKVITAAQRRMITAWLEEGNELARQFSLAMAIVTDNAIIRGALTAVMWMREPAVHTKPVGTMREAVEFVLTALRQHGIDPGAIDPIEVEQDST